MYTIKLSKEAISYIEKNHIKNLYIEPLKRTVCCRSYMDTEILKSPSGKIKDFLTISHNDITFHLFPEITLKDNILDISYGKFMFTEKLFVNSYEYDFSNTQSKYLFDEKNSH